MRPPALFVGREGDLARVRAAAGRLRLCLVYGVAGVGKTSFMLCAAEELAEREGAVLCCWRARRGDSIGTVATHALARLGRPGPAHVRDPVQALAAAAQARPLVLCLDDLHRVEDPALIEAVVDLAARGLPLWVFATSREALAISPLRIDHLSVRLTSLRLDEARRLWEALERLYGPGGTRFEDVVRRGALSPLCLKQAFADPLPGSGSSSMDLEALPPLERELLARLAAFRRPVPAAALRSGRPDAAVEEALRHLARRFLVEVPAPGVLLLHDLVRDAVQSSHRGAGPREHARCLAYYRRELAAAPADEGLALEALHHAVACGEDGHALATLMEYAPNLKRLVPVGGVVEAELAASLEALRARRELPPPLRVLHARLRARQGAVVEARAEVAALDAAGEPLAAAALGEIDYFLGRGDRAVAYLRRAAGDPRLDADARRWSGALLVEALRSSGRIAEAERRLAAEPADVGGPMDHAVREWLRAVLAHDCERYGAAAAAIAAARRWLEQAGMARSLPLLESLDRVVAAARGDSSDPAPPPGEIYDETLFFRLAARHWHTAWLCYRGELAAAAELGRRTIPQTAAGGFEAQSPAGLCVLGEALLGLGRLDEAYRALEAALRSAEQGRRARDVARVQALLARWSLARGEAEAGRVLALRASARARRAPGTRARLRATAALAGAAAGRVGWAGRVLGRAPRAEGFEAAEWRVARAEVLLWADRLAEARRTARTVAAAARAGGWRWLWCRARLLEGEAAWREGDFPAGAAARDEAAAAAQAAGYAVETYRADLLGAAGASAGGDPGEAARRLACVARRAAAAGLQVEAQAARIALAALGGEVPSESGPGVRLARRLGLDEPPAVTVRDAGGTYLLSWRQLAGIDWTRHALVVDLARRRVWSGAAWTDLRGHQLLVDLLRPLARRPGAFVPTSELVREVWRVEYHPLRHKSRIAVAVLRLRGLIGAHLVDGGKSGYRLAAPTSWAVVEPPSGGRGAPPSENPTFIHGAGERQDV